MLLWVLITISLALAGLTGMQFFYMMVLERRDREQKRRIRELERRCVYLAARVDETEDELAEHKQLLESSHGGLDDDGGGTDEVWVDIIEER